eukprot:SAG22_NODE_4_length_44774_cov_362.122149_19_plen_79_part_00
MHALDEAVKAEWLLESNVAVDEAKLAELESKEAVRQAGPVPCVRAHTRESVQEEAVPSCTLLSGVSRAQEVPIMWYLA